LWWCNNGNLYLYQFMCSNNYNMPGYIYSAWTTSCIINLSCKYKYSILFNTSTSKYGVQCMVSYCISKWRMQWYLDK